MRSKSFLSYSLQRWKAVWQRYSSHNQHVTTISFHTVFLTCRILFPAGSHPRLRYAPGRRIFFPCWWSDASLYSLSFPVEIATSSAGYTEVYLRLPWRSDRFSGGCQEGYRPAPGPVFLSGQVQTERNNRKSIRESGNTGKRRKGALQACEKPENTGGLWL